MGKTTNNNQSIRDYIKSKLQNVDFSRDEIAELGIEIKSILKKEGSTS
jgi:hypothetical protein